MAFNIKIQLRDDLRRIALAQRPSYAELRSSISRLFVSRSLHPQFTIKYIDEEGDQVTIESDYELAFALPESHRGSTIRFIINEPSPASPSAGSSTQQQRERVQQPETLVRPAPFDFSQIQNLLRSFGGVGISPCPVQSQSDPINLAPLMNMAMRVFMQPPQQVNQPAAPFDIFSLLSGLAPAFQPQQAPPAAPPAQPEKAPETAAPSTPSLFSCPFEFFQGLIETQLEENEEWKKMAEKAVRRFIKMQTNVANSLPKIEELVSLAVETIVAFITDPEIQQQCPWIKLFAPEQVRGLLDSILASPVVQEIVYTAYSAVSEAFKEKEARQQPATPAPAPAPAPVVAPIPVPAPRVPEPEPVVVDEPVYSEEEKQCLAHLATMGFTDKPLNFRLLRQTNFDLWETIQLLLQN